MGKWFQDFPGHRSFRKSIFCRVGELWGVIGVFHHLPLYSKGSRANYCSILNDNHFSWHISATFHLPKGSSVNHCSILNDIHSFLAHFSYLSPSLALLTNISLFLASFPSFSLFDTPLSVSVRTVALSSTQF